MDIKKVDNQVNFDGHLVKGKFLSNNFEKSVPELSQMIKDKPYDVFVKAGRFYKKRGRIHRTTYFNAINYGYLDKAENTFLEAHAYTNKTRHSSYTYALQSIINDMDAQIENVKSSKKENATVKDKIIKSINSIFS